MKVIYQDNHLLVIEKPINMPSQKDDSLDQDVLSLAKEYIKEKYNKPGDVYLGLVSRLDRPTGGVMVLARTSKAASRLTEAFKDHEEIEKYYLATIIGKLPNDSGIFEDYLLKDSKNNLVKVVDNKTKGSKYAKLEYEVIKQKDNLSLVKIRLYTGRSHQIRVQFASRGFPLFGDQRYNPNAKPHTQLALWSYSLSFNHPTTKERLVFKADLPDSIPWKYFKE